MEGMSGRREFKIVYTITQRSGDGRKFWLRIGRAFTNQDGSMNVYLDAVPTNGQLQIRDRNEEVRAGSTSRTEAEPREPSELFAS